MLGFLPCAPVQVLYFAEFDLQFFKTRSEMLRHLGKCRLQHPPGDEIYRNRTAKGSVSMYEVRALRGLGQLNRHGQRACMGLGNISFAVNVMPCSCQRSAMAACKCTRCMPYKVWTILHNLARAFANPLPVHTNILLLCICVRVLAESPRRVMLWHTQYMYPAWQRLS